MTSDIKSPFYIIPEFISPKKCDEFLTRLNVTEPNRDIDGRPIALERHHDELELEIYPRVKEILPAIEEHYSCIHKGTERMNFQMLPENSTNVAIAAGCMNSKYLRKKWVKVADVDLTCLLWLKDHNETVPLDPRTETYGGRLEFPLYNFSFVPKRGTLIVYPAGPHFISVTSPVLVSDLYQVRFNLNIRNKDESMWLYQPSSYKYDKKKGMIVSWFSEHLS